jgi:hypothetical protein
MSAGEPAPDLPAHIMKRADESYKFSLNMLREIYVNEFEYKKTGLAVFSERAHQAKAELDKELDVRTGFMSMRLNTKAFSPPRRQVMPRSSYMGNNNENNNKTRKRKRQTTLTEPGGLVNLMRNNANKKFTNKLKENTRISRERVQEENRRERQAMADEEDRQAAAEEEELSIPAVRRATMLAENSNKGNKNNSRYGRAIKASQEF